MKKPQLLSMLATSIFIALLGLPSAKAQALSQLTITSVDSAAAAAATGVVASAEPTSLGGANRNALEFGKRDDASLPVIPPPGFYPADLSNPFNGPTIEFAAQHNVYLNPCNISSASAIFDCWGRPADFLANLDQSDFIHVVDQYVGLQGGALHHRARRRCVFRGTAQDDHQ